ncbi:hypothetical protein ACFWIA_30465 [Streptomyces sp. NPDC127068]|uniref:hypothetical protein n=1 Tax=Streptomyces sp. NPDC127068 TaxID=3347127 RepID=UPI00365B5625
MKILASVCAVTTVFAVLGIAPVASAAAPTQECSLLYNARITFWAMTCSQPGEPMIGGFAAWRNVPIAFDQVDTGSATVKAANYVRLMPNTATSSFSPNIEIGLYAEKTGKTTHTYGPRWMEQAAGGGRLKAITAGVNPNKPDGRNHTYMTLRQDTGDQWDILYDFNKVGSTANQLKVIGGNTNRIDVGLEVTGQTFIDVPSIGNRLQFMTGNKVWQKVVTANVARSVTLPGCSTTQKPPNCFTVRLTDSSEFTQWSVSKPRRQAAAVASPGMTTTPSLHGPSIHGATLPSTFNGVDQHALQACMETDPDSCLTTVPGLSECVVTVRICNAAALPSGGSSEGDSARADISSADIRTRAATAFDVPGNTLSVESPTSPARAGARHSEGTKSTDGTWTVSSTSPTPGLQHTGRLFDGLVARYCAYTGALLEACWGEPCNTP